MRVCHEPARQRGRARGKVTKGRRGFRLRTAFAHRRKEANDTRVVAPADDHRRRRHRCPFGHGRRRILGLGGPIAAETSRRQDLYSFKLARSVATPRVIGHLSLYPVCGRSGTNRPGRGSGRSLQRRQRAAERGLDGRHRRVERCQAPRDGGLDRRGDPVGGRFRTQLPSPADHRCDQRCHRRPRGNDPEPSVHPAPSGSDGRRPANNPVVRGRWGSTVWRDARSFNRSGAGSIHLDHSTANERFPSLPGHRFALCPPRWARRTAVEAIPALAAI